MQPTLQESAFSSDPLWWVPRLIVAAHRAFCPATAPDDSGVAAAAATSFPATVIQDSVHKEVQGNVAQKLEPGVTAGEQAPDMSMFPALSNTRGSKRQSGPSQEVDLPAWAAVMQKSIIEVFRAELAPITESLQTITARVDQHDQKLENQEGRIRALEGRSSSPSRMSSATSGSDSEWQPTELKIRGFCSWQNSREEGIIRSDAEVLVSGLQAVLSEAVQAKVGDLVLRGCRNYEVTASIEKGYAMEIKEAWNEALLNDIKFLWRGKASLFCVSNRHPREKQMWSTCGALKEFSEENLKKPGVELKLHWPKSLKAKNETSQGKLVEVASINLDGSVKWRETPCMRFFSLGEAQLSANFQTFLDSR